MNPNSRSPRSLRLIVAASVLLSFLSVESALADNPVPTVVGPPVPQAVVPGSGAFTLKVYGANFVSGAVVNWNRSPRSTMFVSARELHATILAADVAKPTAGYITVTNPPPGGGVSSSSFGLVEVHAPTATIIAEQPHIYLGDSSPVFLILTDFRNDGILDFATSYGKSEIKVLLGNGNGTFGHGSIGTHNYYAAAAIASGDFNNDGNEDLVFGADPNGPPTQLQVSLGNGNGTFRKGSRFGHFDNIWPLDVAVGDFNGDGKLDVIVSAQGIYVFLGNGDGTFKHLVHYSNVGLAGTADFNGDGKLDLVVGIRGGLAVMLGNGDGTFMKPRKIVSISNNFGCPFGPPIVITDFDADGKADLAYCERDQDNGKIWILLGNGNGTFKKSGFVPVQNGIGSFSFAAGDFNSDGKTDLVANYLISDTQSEFVLFLGNGDGTFQHEKLVQIGGGPHEGVFGIVPADFNSDGLLDFIIQDPGQIVDVIQK